ncbi:MAG: hypothetical protein ACRDFB_05215, partial [Rhabdochlamydiaceae bacterium]
RKQHDSTHPEKHSSSTQQTYSFSFPFHFEFLSHGSLLRAISFLLFSILLRNKGLARERAIGLRFDKGLILFTIMVAAFPKR